VGGYGGSSRVQPGASCVQEEAEEEGDAGCPRDATWHAPRPQAQCEGQQGQGLEGKRRSSRTHSRATRSMAPSVLYCTVLSSTKSLRCTVLCFSGVRLYNSVLCCAVLYCRTVLYCTAL